jgi:hypothetical protein
VIDPTLVIAVSARQAEGDRLTDYYSLGGNESFDTPTTDDSGMEPRWVRVAKWLTKSWIGYALRTWVWPAIPGLAAAALTVAWAMTKGLPAASVVLLGVAAFLAFSVWVLWIVNRALAAYAARGPSPTPIPKGLFGSLTMHRWSDLVPTVSFDLGLHQGGHYLVDTGGPVDRIAFREPVSQIIRQADLPVTLRWRPRRRPEYHIIVHDFTDTGVVIEDNVVGVARARFDFYRPRGPQVA